MARSQITTTSIMEHVRKLEDEHPPIRFDSVDRTIVNPAVVRERFAPVIDYLARVELEVDRNVLELLTLLPGVSEVDRYFYQDVWQPQKIAHGVLAPWQLYVARVLREKGFALVGTDYVPRYEANLGALMVGLEIDQELEKYARDIGRLEAKLLWANRNGMEFPPYFLEALRQSIDMYRQHGFRPQAA